MELRGGHRRRWRGREEEEVKELRKVKIEVGGGGGEESAACKFCLCVQCVSNKVCNYPRAFNVVCIYRYQI